MKSRTINLSQDRKFSSIKNTNEKDSADSIVTSYIGNNIDIYIPVMK